MGISYNNSITTDGLVLCLDAANPRSYPGSGTSWLDISGNGKYGTLTNGPTFSSDNAGVINFDGVNDYCATQISSPMVNTQNGSIETWIKFTNDTDLSSANMQVYMIPCPNSLYLYFYRNAPWPSYAMSNFLYYRRASNGTSGSNIPYIYYYPNIWYQNVLTWSDTGIQKIYQNGILKHSATSSDFDYWYAPNGSNFIMSVSYSFEGSISQLKMYNRTLSADEVRRNYNATRGRYGN